MKFIEEIVVEEFLPTVRSMLAEALRERGLTQREVATALGISQSAVSKYAHGDVERNRAVLDDSRVQELVDRVADGLASGSLSQVGALLEIEVTIRQLERGDLLATLHEEAMPGLAGTTDPFSVHDPDSELRASEQVLASVRRGLRLLENTAGFPSLIPHVGTNLVECTPTAVDIQDVGGVPGRVFAVKGDVSVPAGPEFGASEHVASVLLAMRAQGNPARAALNIRYAAELVEILKAEGLTAVEFDAEYDDVESAVSVEAAETADVIYQTGGFGIEPMIYILAPDATTAVERVRTLIQDE